MITETEQAYITRIREYFGNELVSVDTHPGDWSDSVLRTMLINAPAIWMWKPSTPCHICVIPCAPLSRNVFRAINWLMTGRLFVQVRIS